MQLLPVLLDPRLLLYIMIDSLKMLQPLVTTVTCNGPGKRLEFAVSIVSTEYIEVIMMIVQGVTFVTVTGCREGVNSIV